MGTIQIISVVLSVVIAYIGSKKGKKFLTAILLGLFFTPIASSIYVFSKGKFSTKLLVTVCIVLLVMMPIVLFAVVLNYDRISDAICNSTMKDLNYSSAHGDHAVAYLVEEDEYTWEYIPDDLRARSAEDVGYVLEIRYILRTKESFGRGTLKANAFHATLIECATGRIIAEKIFEPTLSFRIAVYGDPGSASSTAKSANIEEEPEAYELRKWMDEVFPR